ncbi:MAG: hypothetical protein JSV65_16090 [Armatimonadota bacterium]|nr:MAG: hypothetical protein JSV65_16090 [Armatimonadota bacterium]
MSKARRAGAAIVLAVLGVAMAAGPACALDRPWVSDVFFYWYDWDDEQQWGDWGTGGVYYTPLAGYYDSGKLETNRSQIQTAAEWGMTHHFMDYWDPSWQGEGGVPRDRILMQAAEQVRGAGYQASMGYYQDGTNFEMRDFALNVSEQRDVHHWLENYAPFEAWPRLNGYPFQLVYGRNGAPETTIDHEGFRDFLARRYAGLDALNAAWGTQYESFDDIEMAFDVRGPQRADSVGYQYLLWEREWAKLNNLVREEFGYPGIKASFDVGYAPFRGFGFCDFARVFGGPHSYAGIFGPPHGQDVERFIQSIVAKRYDTVFFDHLKGYYCDWNTLGRIPGMQYPAEPFTYDRFWVGDLMRYNEAVLHLSWNEWWEGSNLEPSLELGKQYCEQNLFYSTLMQACFPSLRDFGKGASVAVLLNDWAFKCGSPHVSEIYTVIQELRRSMVPFDLLVDDLIAPSALRRFDLIFAPAARVGFGRNAHGDAIAPILVQWLNSDARHRLVASDCRELRELLGLAVQPSADSERPGADLSVFVEVGEPGDERYLSSGFGGREDWSELPEGAYGKTEETYTVRWTPADARSLRFVLPVSPNRNHIMRFSGNAMWPSEVVVRVDGEEVDRVQLQEGTHDYRAHVPRAVIGPHDFIAVELFFAAPLIPREVDPERFPDEGRACNLALDWIQISTANLEFSREQFYEPPSPLIDFNSPLYGPLAGQSRDAFVARRDSLTAPGAEVTARYRAGGVARDLLLRDRRVFYVNGQMDDAAPEEWMAAVLERWAGARAATRVSGDSVIGAALRAENTVILLAYNYDPARNRLVEFAVESLGRPVSRVTALRRDGEEYAPISWSRQGDRVLFSDRLRYCGVYEVVFAPAKVEVERVTLHPGEEGRLPVLITAASDAQTGTLALVSPVPSIAMQGAPVPFQVRPGETARVRLPVVVRDDADWGQKTVAVRVETAHGAALIFRPLHIEPNPNIEPSPAVLDGRRPRLTLVNTPPPGAERCATATGVTVEVEGQQVSFGAVAAGAQVTRALPITQPFAGRPRLAKIRATVRYALWGKQVSQEHELDLGVVPAESSGPSQALAAVHVFNAAEQPLENHPVVVQLPVSLSALADRLYVMDDAGRSLPSQVDSGAELAFIGRIPARSGATFYLSLASNEAERPGAGGSAALMVEPLSRLTGTVRLANSRLSAVISAPHGGTLVSLRSQATGREYAAESLGAAYGKWSAPVDLTSPARQPQGLIAEERVRQADRPAEVSLLSSGPVRAVVRVAWEDEHVRCRQTYELRAFQPYLHFRSEVTPKDSFAAQELVLLDGRFNAAGLTKIYPGFSGMLGEFQSEHPHFGWREGPHVPEVATMMDLPDSPESISLVFTETAGADWWRQGFWPENRPEPGPCKFAWCELVSTTGGAGEADGYVLLHDGHQAIAEAFRRGLERPPLVVVVEVSRERKQLSESPAPKLPADWWSPHWRVRLPVRVKVAADARLPAVAAVRFDPFEALRTSGIAGQLDTNSVRVVERGAEGQAEAELPAVVSRADEEVIVSWQVLPSAPWRGERVYHIYFDTLANGPRAPHHRRAAALLPVLADPSMEEEERCWALEGTAAWERGDAHSGRVAARLESQEPTGVGLVSVPNFPAASASEYLVTFWAKVLDGAGALHANFFAGLAYDFTQQQVAVPTDGQWHRVSVVAPTGDLPPGVRPALRIWTIGINQAVLVDDVTVQDLQRAGAIEVEMDKLEVL